MPGEQGVDLTARLAELAELRTGWAPAPAAALRRRRHYAAWATAGIEGNPLPWRTARALLRGERKPQDLADAELLGCLRALDFIDAQPPALPWREALLRHLHGLLMQGLSAEAGSYRRHAVRIVRAAGPERGEQVFAPPHAARVPELLGGLLESLDPGEDPFLQAGRFHYEFQSIHPFADGNGRLGRLLSTALARRGWQGTGFYCEAAVQRAGAAYYLALRAVRADYQSKPRDGLRPWLLPFLAMLEDGLRHPDPPADPEPGSQP